MKKLKLENIFAVFALLGVLLLFGSFLFDGATKLLAICSLFLAIGGVIVVALLHYVAKRVKKHNGVFGIVACSIFCMMICITMVVHVDAALSFTPTVIEQSLSVTATASADSDSNFTGDNGNGSTSRVTVVNGVITVSAKGYTDCAKANKSDKITITVTNNTQSQVMYDLTYSGNVTTSAEQGEGLVLDSGGRLTFTVTSALGASEAAVDATITFSNVQTVAQDVEVSTTFLGSSTGGSYKIDGTLVENDVTQTKKDSEVYNLVATPSSGYTFYCWMSSNLGAISYESTCQYKPLAGTVDTVWPVFVVENGPAFYVKGESPRIYYSDWSTAVEVAQNSSSKVVVLANNATFSAGTYTVPDGITFLVPFDEAATVITDDMEDNLLETADEKFEFRKLTLASGASINVESGGALCVGSRAYKQMTGQAGPYGTIFMNQGSSITVNANAYLYAWGYIFPGEGEAGTGAITIKNGGIVYENLSVYDYPGGADPTQTLYNAGVFPVRAYAINNVEAPMTYEAGAKEYVFFSMWGSNIFVGYKNGYSCFVNGEESSETALFTLKSGATLKKEYSSGKHQLTFNGDTNLNTLTITVVIKVSTSSTKGIPIPSGFNVLCESGTITLNENMIMTEGTKLTIAQGAVVDTNGKNIYVLDATDDKGAKSSTDVHGTAFTTVNEDAVIDVNGELITSGGFYTSNGGASIISSAGTGTITVSGSSTATTLNFKTSTSTNTSCVITPAKLQHSDGTYTAATVATTYTYTGGYWRCAENTHTDEDSDNFCDICGYVLACTHASTEVIPAKDPTCTETGLTAGVKCSVCGETLTAQEEITALGHTDNNNDHNCDTCGTKLSDCTDNDKNHKCDVCDAKLSDCADTDNDHKCDVCDTALSECADENNDHNCDVCGTKLSECADNDKNHKCDVCDTKLSDCADNDKNHKCDVCDAKLSDCADNDKNHKCDVCEEVLTTCVDGNNDHKCDVCEEALTTCVDGNNDHKCDVCGTELSKCADGNNDHKCDVCDTKLSECSDSADDSDHKCDVCDAEIGTHEYGQVTYTGDGKTSYSATRTCNCGDQQTATATISFAVTKDPTCTVTGVKTYTAKFDVDWADEKITTEEIPVLGHKDEGKDHVCDNGCGIAQGTHADANKDHVCDYGCKEAIGSHEDTAGDKNHTCDYCTSQEALTECKDTDADNYCNECGNQMCQHADKKHVPAVSATCTTDGNVEHWICQSADCGRYYLDKQCTQLTSAKDVMVPAGHTEVKDAAKDPTCTDTGLTEGKHCSACKEVLIAQEEIPATGHKDVDPANNVCDVCNAKLEVTITFIGFDGSVTEVTAQVGETVDFPASQAPTGFKSYTFQFLGWKLVNVEGEKGESDTLITDASVVATADATYKAVYTATFTDGSLMISVEYGATGNIVLYASLFVYVDNGSNALELSVQSNTMMIGTPHKFEIPGHNQDIYMYKIPMTANDISSGAITISIGGYQAKTISQVLFSYADALNKEDIVEDKENAELEQAILDAQQTLITDIMNYGSSVHAYFDNDTSYLPEGQEEKFPAITAGDYNVTYEIVKDHAETSFYGASGSFGTLLGLRYYYNVSLKEGTITKVGVIVTDTPLNSPSGAFTDSSKLIISENSNNANATYMSTITGLNVNELDDKYATIYVEYKDAKGETQYVYGDTMKYGLERYLKKQVYTYSPTAYGGLGETVSKQQEENATGKETIRYVNLLINILKANDSAKALEALRASKSE